MKVFVPIEAPADLPADASRLVPYRYGMRLWSVEVMQAEGQALRTQSRCSSNRSPGSTPRDSATPALSSSTY